MKNKSNLSILSATLVIVVLCTTANSQDKTFTAAQNLGAIVNSTSNDAAAVISPSGLSLFFTSSRSGGQGGSDIWVSHRGSLNSAWGAPQNLGATVNSPGTDSVGSFSIDGKTMFLQSDRPGGQGARDNYVSTRIDPNNDFGWTTPVNLGPVVNSSSNELAPAYFEDPTTGVNSIFFGTDRVGIPDIEYHIYQAVRNPDGTFQAPVPVPELNAGSETRVAIRRDGLEIFIASVRTGGIEAGQFDIWTAHRSSTAVAWSTPELAPAINSVRDETSPTLSPDGAILYFVSPRDGGMGGNDLYSATRCSLYATNAVCNVNRTVADFDGDGRADISIFRPADGTWWLMESATNTVIARRFGANGDRIAPGDYDGDGRMDMAVFRASDPAWWISKSSDNYSSFSVTQFGLSTDKPTPGDYDGDGRTDLAVYRNGTWYVLQSSNGQVLIQQFGLSSDVPVAGVQ